MRVRPVSRCIGNIVFYGAPLLVAAVGVYRLYQSTRLDGHQAVDTLTVGLLLLACSVGFVSARRVRLRTRRDDEWEARLESMQEDQGQRLRRLEKEADALKLDVHSRLTMRKWLEIFDRVDAHHAGSWVELNRKD